MLWLRFGNFTLLYSGWYWLLCNWSKHKRHFDVLNNRDYYNLNLDPKTISVLYKKYRCLLTHNAVLATDVVLDIGSQNAPVYEFKNGKHLLNLGSFLEITRISLEKFLKDSNNIVNSSKQLQEILKS